MDKDKRLVDQSDSNNRLVAGSSGNSGHGSDNSNNSSGQNSKDTTVVCASSSSSLAAITLTNQQDKAASKPAKLGAILKLGHSSKLNKLLSEDDPKPGPSNSAADFDLEVFDSGSSCSNEECWITDNLDKKLSSETALDKEVEAFTHKMQEYPSDGETELSSNHDTRTHHRETQTGRDLLERDPVPSTSQEVSSVVDPANTSLSQPRSSVSAGVVELPEETLDSRESVQLWKSKNETETIVEDHDVYGTDENEDSLDSLVQNEDSMDSLALSSRRTSVCDQSEVILVDQNLSRCCSRTSNPESVAEVGESEDAHQPICDLYTQTCSPGTGGSYEVNTSASSSENFRPKRKSGSFTELSLACLPLKRQKPETSGSSSNNSISVHAFNPSSIHPSLREERTTSTSHTQQDSLWEEASATNDSIGNSATSAVVAAASIIPTTAGTPAATSTATLLAENTPLADTSSLIATSDGDTTAVAGGSSKLLHSTHNSSTDQREGCLGLNKNFFLDLEENSYLSLCDNTAPTSPASPEPAEPLDDTDETAVERGRSPSPHTPPQPSPRALFSPGVSRTLIPDRENPPAEILGWVSTFSRWSNAERLMAINQLIHTCEPQQVRHMMQVIEPQFQRDFLLLLPKELALYVLSFLHPKDLLRAAQTCRYWRVLAEDNLLWREKCREAGLQDCRETRRRKAMSGFTYSPWKAGYMRQHYIEMNWRINPVRNPKVLKGHDDHVITCLQFSGNRIVSGSDDNTLKVWSAITGKCLRTLVGHSGGVWSSQMQGNTIVSGSTDRTLKVWNADTGSLVHTLYGHTSTVRCMHLHDNKVVSGSRDATLRMWDIETGECNIVLVGHVAAVRCVQYDGRLVVSGAYDYMVKVWNPEREECIHTLSGHTNRVYSLQFDGTHVVSGSLDTSIRVWDVETGTCKHALMGHQSLTSGMELKDNILVSGNADSTVKIWDIISGQCLLTLSGPNKHQSAVTCLHFNKRFVVTSSDDGTVKLWDVKTGDYIRDLVSLESGGAGGVVWRIRSSPTRLVCAVGSRNGTEETKLLVLDFDAEVK